MKNFYLVHCLHLLLILWPVMLAGPALAVPQKPTAGPPVIVDSPPVPIGMVVEFDGPEMPLLQQRPPSDWSHIDFAGGGPTSEQDGILTIEAGEMLSGVYWDGGSLPTKNYELSLEARRVQGIDFFCGCAFPVNDTHCCLIVGGWAGATVGLSNINNRDASRNDTTRLMALEDNRWYRARIRVLPDRIIVWLDDVCVIYENISGKKVSLRGDTELLTPMGLCTFATTAQIRNMTLRRIVADEDRGTTEPASDPADKLPQRQTPLPQ